MAEPPSSERLDVAWGAMMVRAQAGDRVAYERLLRECTPFIRRIARFKRVHPDTVDDVVQDVILAVHRARHTYDPARSFSAWLAAIALRRAIDALRRDGRRTRREINEPLAYESHPDPAPGCNEDGPAGLRAAAIAQAVDLLPSGQREAIDMLALRQMSLSEAAMFTGKTKDALKMNMHRALRTLRARFKADAR